MKRARARRIERRLRLPRSLLPSDRRIILRELNLRCREGDRGTVSFSALRLRAIVLLAGGSGLRISEVCKLNAAQMLDDVGARWKLRSLAYLRPEQAKGRRVGPQQWESSGVIMVSDSARSALRAYIVEARKRGYIPWPPKPRDALFVTVRGNWKVGAGRHRLSVRTLQQQWLDFQRRAGIDAPYHFHCLRHEALTRCSEATHGNTRAVAEFGRCDVMTALRYTHVTPQAMLELRNVVAL